MSKPSIPLTIPRGTTYRKTFIWKYGPTEGPYDPVNLTGYTGRMHFRSDILSPNTLVSLTLGSGISFSESTGAITITLTPAMTTALTSSGVYDIEVVTLGGDTLRPFGGSFTSYAGVTHD